MLNEFFAVEAGEYALAWIIQAKVIRSAASEALPDTCAKPGLQKLDRGMWESVLIACALALDNRDVSRLMMRIQRQTLIVCIGPAVTPGISRGSMIAYVGPQANQAHKLSLM
jgi:hypothetical protein